MLGILAMGIFSYISDTMGRRRLCFVWIRDLTLSSIELDISHSVRKTIDAEELFVLRSYATLNVNSNSCK